MTILINEEKIFDNIQDPFMTKKLSAKKE